MKSPLALSQNNEPLHLSCIRDNTEASILDSQKHGPFVKSPMNSVNVYVDLYFIAAVLCI